jgi:hypothetical protein
VLIMMSPVWQIEGLGSIGKDVMAMRCPVGALVLCAVTEVHVCGNESISVDMA